MPWSIAPHTADLAIEATGGDAGAVLAEAALGMTAVLTGHDVPRAIPPDAEMRFSVQAPDEHALAVAFLAELVWLFESKDLLWVGGGVEVADTSDGGLEARAVANVAHHDAARHGRGVEVKAVTYHGLEFARTGRAWHVRVLLDI